MDDLQKKVRQLKEGIAAKLAKAKLDDRFAELAELKEQMSQADFWQDSGRAQTVSKRYAQLERQVQPIKALSDEASELSELVQLYDTDMMSELNSKLKMLQSRLDELNEATFLNGPYDDHGVILAIYAGAGGTDAQDWAQMLLRMYVRWAESHKLKVKPLEESVGEEAGIKSATIEITGGQFLYGRLGGEHGVHRLVRLSPFNAANLRQTSFAKVEVLPLIDSPGEADISDEDLKIDVFRSGGRGGQSVNTTDSAVRLTHIPTGISVSIQNERSQMQNKQTALTILRSKLTQLKLEQHAKNLAEIKGPSQSAEFGNQIRNYVLHPYKQVKDLRSGYESSDVENVLAGKIDPLIEAGLKVRQTA
ncbi:MAG: peptide chain release factor 2 [Candidatus Saccharimonadales bacterium]